MHACSCMFQENVTYDMLSKMKYLEMCMNETLRLYAPFAA